MNSATQIVQVPASRRQTVVIQIEPSPGPVVAVTPASETSSSTSTESKRVRVVAPGEVVEDQIIAQKRDRLRHHFVPNFVLVPLVGRELAAEAKDKIRLKSGH